jgi:hypothetical protein
VKRKARGDAGHFDVLAIDNHSRMPPVVRLPKDAFQPTMVATAEDNRGKYGVQSSSRIYKCSVPSMIEEARSAGVAKRSDYRTLGYHLDRTRQAADGFPAR